MKLLTFLPFLVFPIHLFAQQEKGCTIKDCFRIYYEGGDFSNSKHNFSYTSPWKNSSNLNAQDTLKVENNAHAKIVMHWIYSNQYYDMYYPAYDSVQWFYNDAPSDSSVFLESIDLDHHQICSYSLSTLSQGMYLCNLYDPEVSEVVYRIKLKKL